MTFFSPRMKFASISVSLGMLSTLGTWSGMAQEPNASATARYSAITSTDPAGASSEPAAATTTASADPSSAPLDPAGASLDPATASSPNYVVAGKISNCGDALSEALGQSGRGMPCWSDIRAVDHWNTLSLGRSMAIYGNAAPVLPEGKSKGFSYTAGPLSSFLFFPNGAHAQGYAGVAAVSGFLKMHKWQMTVEDGGGLADIRSGNDTFAGMNRAALRASGSVATRWYWQGGVTNYYGNDALRTVGPLDYRKVGSGKNGSMEAPVTDIVAYGLHAGNVIDEQEDFKMDFQQSRRTSVGFSLAHTLRHYEDDGVTGQTERARAELLHSVSPDAAVGLFAIGSRQFGSTPCSLAGMGAVGLLQWGSRASISASGAIDGASATCGKRVQGTGDLALYVKAAPRTDFFVTADRDLSGGVVETAALLNSASTGVRQRFHSGASVRLAAVALNYNDVATTKSHTGTFLEADGLIPIGRNLLQETSYRHYQVSSLPIKDNLNALTFTLWWTPKRNEAAELTAHR